MGGRRQFIKCYQYMISKQVKIRSSLRLKSKTPLEKDEVHKINTILMHLNNHSESIDFREPVDWKGLELYDYPDVIKYPMDLATINKKLREKKYKTVQAVLNDVQLIWDNCKMYNTKNSDIYDIADKLELAFRRMVRNYLPNLKIATVTSTPVRPITEPPFIIVHKPEREYDKHPEPIKDPQPPVIVPVSKKDLLIKVGHLSEADLQVFVTNLKHLSASSWQEAEDGWARIDAENMEVPALEKLNNILDEMLKRVRGQSVDFNQRQLL